MIVSRRPERRHPALAVPDDHLSRPGNFPDLGRGKAEREQFFYFRGRDGEQQFIILAARQGILERRFTQICGGLPERQGQRYFPGLDHGPRAALPADMAQVR